MDRLFIWLIAAIAAIAIGLVGLAIYVDIHTPETGYVTGKQHAAAWTQISCNPVGKVTVCTPIQHPESWCLDLKGDNGDKGCRGVDEATWNRYEVGDHYPDPR